MSIIFNAFLPILELRWVFFSYLILIFHIHQIKIKITSPLRHQGINVHQQGQDLKRLMKTRLVSVEGDKKCALKCFVTQPTFTWKKKFSCVTYHLICTKLCTSFFLALRFSLSKKSQRLT